MKRSTFRLTLAGFAFSAAAFAVASLASAPALAGKKPPKPCPNCAPTITLPDGRVCTLSACGFDCVYTCPL